MRTLSCILLALAAIFFSVSAFSQSSPAKSPDSLPYSPSLDVSSLDRSVDPCVDLYHFACGGWQKKNPIPADQTSWSVYGKLYQDNLNFLRTILEQAASSSGTRTPVTQQIGDFYAACMDETGAEKRGLSPVQPELDSIAKLKSAKEIAALMSHLQLTYGASVVFNAGSSLDPDNSEQQIAQIDQGGLGLPDRDYYVKDDAKSKETRDRYVQHVQHLFEFAGDSSEAAKANAETVMRLETLLAKASLTRVERRNPYNLKHKMKLAELNQLAPNFDWAAYSVRPNIHSSKSSTSAHPSSSKKSTLS